MEVATVAPIQTNDDRIVQAATEEAVNTVPNATTPPPIDQVLVNTPVFNVRDAAELLGDLAGTAVAGSKTDRVANKRKTTMSSPALSTPTTRRNRRRIQERS
jgi:hypothetical protein